MSDKAMAQQTEDTLAHEVGAEDTVDDEDWGDVDKSYFVNKGVK